MTVLPRELGDFVLEKLIGQGGMGEVYYGHQKSLERPVAIKLLRDEYARDENFITRFKREAKSAAKLIHPNIIQVYQLGEEKGEYYFAMEFVEGKDLQQILKEKKGKLSLSEVLHIMQGVAKALEIAGTFGIVHRDIKPSNVLITKDNTIKVMDFGLAKAFQDSSTNVTMSGAVMGTANYMSPEQAEGRDVDQRTDIYSLGVMFYQLLTSYLPFSGENPTSLAFQHVHSKPIPPMQKMQGISQALNDICIKCLAKQKEDRYQSATEFLNDLQLVITGDGSRLVNKQTTTSMNNKSMIDSSSEATLASEDVHTGVDFDRTFVPNMTSSTKVEKSSLTQPNAQTVLNTAIIASEKTNIQLQEERADSARIATQKIPQKTNWLYPFIILATLAVIGAGWFFSQEKSVSSHPKNLQEVSVINHEEGSKSELVKSTENMENKTKLDKEVPKESAPINNTNMPIVNEETPSKTAVEISLVELKSRLPKGFKIRMGILDDQNQKLSLDDIKSINRLPGIQMIEITHDFYNPIIEKIKVEQDGKFSLEAIPIPQINHEKLIQQIDNFFMVNRQEELEKMLQYGFNGKDLGLLKDRIRILNLESDAKKVWAKGGRPNLIQAYNLIAGEAILSPEGATFKKQLQQIAEKDSKILLDNHLMQEVKETLITNASGISFEIIEPGEFEMGSDSDLKNPKHKVKITKRFAIGKYEITNKEFRMIYPEHISNSVLDKNMNGETQPAVFIDWLKAKKFCEKLSQKEGKKYRLPTEAEWEYCARAGVKTDFSWGATANDFKKNANVLDKGVPEIMLQGNEAFDSTDGFIVTAPVGSFAPNAFKLFDMDGNVREWVSDFYVESLAFKEGEADPQGPASGNKHCVRGASFNAGTKTGSLYYRQGRFDDEKMNDVGFRIVMELDDAKE